MKTELIYTCPVMEFIDLIEGTTKKYKTLKIINELEKGKYTILFSSAGEAMKYCRKYNIPEDKLEFSNLILDSQIMALLMSSIFDISINKLSVNIESGNVLFFAEYLKSVVQKDKFELLIELIDLAIEEKNMTAKDNLLKLLKNNLLEEINSTSV